MKSSDLNENLNTLTENTIASQIKPAMNDKDSVVTGNTSDVNSLDEPIQVAAAGTKTLKKYLEKKLKERLQEKEVVKKEEEVVVPTKKQKEVLDLTEQGKVGPYHVIGEADPKIGAEIINKTPAMPKEGRPKGGKKDGVKIPKTPINVNMIESEEDFKQHILATAEVFGVKDVAGKISYDTITSKFNKTFSVQSGKTSKTKSQFAV